MARPTRGVSFRNNLWWGGKRDTRAAGSGDVLADPQFTDPGGSDPEDYRLRPASPARDKARRVSSVTTDHFGNRRGSTPDLGAHEL